MSNLAERVKAALLLKPSQFYATETRLGLSRSQRHTAIDVAEIANARLAAMHSALVQAVSALAGRTMHDEDCSDHDEAFGEHETCECGAITAQQALAAIEKVLGEK